MNEKKRHIKNYFYDWYSKTLSDNKLASVNTHLKICDGCRIYYEKMTSALDHADLSSLPKLTADPFLAEKIMRGYRPKTSGKKLAALPAYIRWSFASVVFALSFMLGIYLGKGIFNNKEFNEETQLTSAYYQYFSQSSVLEGFDELLITTNEDNHESKDTH